MEWDLIPHQGFNSTASEAKGQKSPPVFTEFSIVKYGIDRCQSAELSLCQSLDRWEKNISFGVQAAGKLGLEEKPAPFYP